MNRPIADGGTQYVQISTINVFSEIAGGIQNYIFLN